MIALEAHFLDMILELAAMRQPVTPTDALALINSMISTSNLSDVIIAWKKKHLPGTFDDDQSAVLGKNTGKILRRDTLKKNKKKQFALTLIEKIGATRRILSPCTTMFTLPW